MDPTVGFDLPSFSRICAVQPSPRQMAQIVQGCDTALAAAPGVLRRGPLMSGATEWPMR